MCISCVRMCGAIDRKGSCMHAVLQQTPMPRGRIAPVTDETTTSSSEVPAGSRSHTPTVLRRGSLMQDPVLILNATYEPINVTAVRRAMVLMLKGVAQAG